MTGLIIAAVIVILIVFLLNCPAVVYISFYDNKPDIRVKYLFLTLFPKKEKEAEKEESTEDKPEEKSADENGTEAVTEDDKKLLEGDNKEEKKKKQPFFERISALIDDLTAKKDAFLDLWELCSGHLKRLCGKISIDRLKIDFAAADEDAAQAALAYGRLNGAVYNVLGFMRSLIKVKIESVNIDCLFNTPSEQSRYDAQMRVKLRPASVLNAVGGILLGYVGGLKKYSAALSVFMKKKSK